MALRLNFAVRFLVATDWEKRFSPAMLTPSVRFPASLALVSLVGFLIIPCAQEARSAAGIFEGSADVGGPNRAGAVVFDAVRQSYAVSGGGKNMWFTNDVFHFVEEGVGRHVACGGHRVSRRGR